MRIPFVAGLIVGAFLVVSAVSADPRQQPADDRAKAEKGNATEADEQYRRDAARLVDGIAVEVRVGDTWTKVGRVAKPLLYYGDATRENDRGSVWAWGEKGRPAALLELFQSTNDRTKWAFALCNTSGGKLRASRGGGGWWQENDSATELKDVPAAPAPATDPAQRQRQLKLLAGKFTGHEFWDPNNSRFELRRLERPLHTYRDEESGLLEGALYILANGTNPELLLFIEARVDPKDKTKSAWQFAVGRSAHAELHLEYDGKEVYAAPRGDRVSGPNKPYWLGFINTAPEK
jgi:hypothetical protein